MVDGAFSSDSASGVATAAPYSHAMAAIASAMPMELAPMSAIAHCHDGLDEANGCVPCVARSRSRG